MAKKISDRMNMATSNSGLVVVSSRDAASYIPNFSGMPLKKAGADSKVSYFPQRWQSPLLSWTNYYIPWDRATLYQWIRHYDTFHPIIGSCVDLHAQLPLSRFGLRGISDQKVLNFYEEMMEELDAYILMYGMLREWWLIGEVFVYLVWDDNLKMFTRARVLPPEYVQVKGHSLVTGVEDPYEYYLIPDDELKIFVENAKNDVSDEKVQNLPPEVIEAIEEGKNIRINPFNLMTMMRKQSEYNPRGTSLVLRALKDLLYEDKLREAQYAIADRLVLPKEIWKIGNEKYLPSESKLKSFAELVRTLEDMPKFNLVTNYTVNYEVIGAVGKFPNLATEFDWVEKRILTAMFTNKALTTGEGPCYDKYTEVLTDNGFKFYDEVTEDDLIATFNKNTEQLEYQKPLQHHKWNYNGEMIYFNTGKIDVCVTPDHRMLVQRRNHDPHIMASEWEVVEAKDVKNRDGFRSCVEWFGIEEPYVKIGNKEIDTCLFMKFLGYIVTEGWATYNTETRNYQVSLDQSIHSDCFKDIDLCMSMMPFDVHKYYRDDEHQKEIVTWVICNKELAEYMNMIGQGARNKHIPKEFKQYGRNYLKILLKAMINGDGHQSNDNGTCDSYEFISASKQLADDVCEIALKCGYSPYLSLSRIKDGIYLVYFSESDIGKYPKLETKSEKKTVIERIPYNDYVWCFEVPNGFFITRRNGRIAIQGNTYANASVAMRALLSRYLEARARLESAWVQSVFLPTAITNEFYKITPAQLEHKIKKPLKDREPLIPEFDWRYKTNLLDDASYREALLRLRDKKQLPMKTILEALGLDYDTTSKWMEEERGTIFDPDFEELYKKKLLEKGIEPEDVPALLNNETQPPKPTASKKEEEVTEDIKKNIPRQDKKDRRVIDKGNPEDLKKKPSFPAKEYMWGSRGGLDRKIAIAEMLVKQKDNIRPLDKIEINSSLVKSKENIPTIPKELEKQMNRKKDIVVMSHRFKGNKNRR